MPQHLVFSNEPATVNDRRFFKFVFRYRDGLNECELISYVGISGEDYHRVRLAGIRVSLTKKMASFVKYHEIRETYLLPITDQQAEAELGPLGEYPNVKDI